MLFKKDNTPKYDPRNRIEVRTREYEPGKFTHDIYVNGEVRVKAIGLSLVGEVLQNIFDREIAYPF